LVNVTPYSLGIETAQLGYGGRLHGDLFTSLVRPDGLSDFNVIFQLDVNGILDVTVVERKSGKCVSERSKASRQRLSPDDIAQSQAKWAAAYTEMEAVVAEAALDHGVAVLLDRAQKALDQPDLEAELVDGIAGAMADIRHAVAAGDDAQVEKHCEELIDLLIEVEVSQHALPLVMTEDML